MTASRPTVRVIATGGSIAGVGPNRLDFILYPELGQHLTIAQSLERIPEVDDIARVRSEDLVSVGAYVPGSNPRIDEARSRRDAIEAFLCQSADMLCGFTDAVQALEAL